MNPTTVVKRAASVLIVEDNESDAEIVVDWFEQTGRAVTIRVASDGREALELLRGGPETPNLIFLDLNLPRMGGLDTLRELKADPDLRTIPVVVLTTSKSSREIMTSYELGASAVLNKPMRLAGYRELLSTVDAFWFDHALLPGDDR